MPRGKDQKSLVDHHMRDTSHCDKKSHQKRQTDMRERQKYTREKLGVKEIEREPFEYIFCADTLCQPYAMKGEESLMYV